MQSNEDKSKISMLESTQSISVNDCLLEKYENHVPPDNVNAPSTLTLSGRWYAILVPEILIDLTALLSSSYVHM